MLLDFYKKYKDQIGTFKRKNLIATVIADDVGRNSINLHYRSLKRMLFPENKTVHS